MKTYEVKGLKVFNDKKVKDVFISKETILSFYELIKDEDVKGINAYLYIKELKGGLKENAD